MGGPEGGWRVLEGIGGFLEGFGGNSGGSWKGLGAPEGVLGILGAPEGVWGVSGASRPFPQRGRPPVLRVPPGLRRLRAAAERHRRRLPARGGRPGGALSAVRGFPGIPKNPGLTLPLFGFCLGEKRPEMVSASGFCLREGRGKFGQEFLGFFSLEVTPKVKELGVSWDSWNSRKFSQNSFQNSLWDSQNSSGEDPRIPHGIPQNFSQNSRNSLQNPANSSRDSQNSSRVPKILCGIPRISPRIPKIPSGVPRIPPRNLQKCPTLAGQRAWLLWGRGLSVQPIRALLRVDGGAWPQRGWTTPLLAPPPPQNGVLR